MNQLSADPTKIATATATKRASRRTKLTAAEAQAAEAILAALADAGGLLSLRKAARVASVDADSLAAIVRSLTKAGRVATVGVNHIASR